MEGERYPAKCCECGHEFMAGKSIMQRSGANDMGCGSCPECEQFLNLTFDPETETMKTKKWNDYLQEIKEEG